MRPAIVVGLGLAAILPGCGSGEFHHRVVPAGGTVVSKGKPVADAIVTFHPADPEMIALPEGETGPEIARPTTRTDADGRFALSTYYADDGAPPGDYTVTVVWAPKTLAVSVSGDEEDTDAEPDLPPNRASTASTDKLGGRYADPATSTLKATIAPGEPNQFEFSVD